VIFIVSASKTPTVDAVAGRPSQPITAIRSLLREIDCTILHLRKTCQAILSGKPAANLSW
jgi:hypothetical protein